jgi:hypothetical protein
VLALLPRRMKHQVPETIRKIASWTGGPSYCRIQGRLRLG